MSAFQESKISRVQAGASGGGQFAPKSNSAPGAALTSGAAEYDDDEITTVTDAYVAAALWSSVDDEGQPLDEYEPSEDLRTSMREDVSSFLADNSATLRKLEQSHGYTAEQAGHDFWLTRNGHGAGFWDRGLGDDGDVLSESARSRVELDLYVGDDGRVHA